jgi:chromatin remodeling complex protein RSC6
MEATKTVVKANKMPADKKTKSTPAPQTATPAPETTPAPTKGGRKTAAKAEVQVPVTATPVTTETAAPAEVRSSDVILASLQETLKALGSEVTTRIREAVKDAVEATKAIKREARDSKKRRRVDPATMTPEERKAWEARRANNAFLKMRPISDELCSFMGLPAKSQRSQTDVTKFVSNYVKSHNCFDPNFKRRILPDAKLAKLLRAKDGQEVTYLNLQSFLKVHFLKPTA